MAAIMLILSSARKVPKFEGKLQAASAALYD